MFQFPIGIFNFVEEDTGGGTRIFGTEKVWNHVYVFELDPSDLTELDYVDESTTSWKAGKSYGIGGAGDDIFIRAENDSSNNYLFTLNKATLDEATTVDTTPLYSTMFVGGMSSRLFGSSGSTTDKLFELDPSDGSIIGSEEAGHGSNARDVGGTDDQLFHVDTGNDGFFEVDPDDLSTALQSDTSTWGTVLCPMGGNSTQMFARYSSTPTYIELDPDDIGTSLQTKNGWYHSGESSHGSIGGLKS